MLFSYENQIKELADIDTQITHIRCIRTDITDNTLAYEAAKESYKRSCVNATIVKPSEILKEWARIACLGKKLPFED